MNRHRKEKVIMLEKMGEFFDHRLNEYEEHQFNCIAYAKEFYLFTAHSLPRKVNARILDLGCGTGLELEPYYEWNPSAQITGIDLAPGMLQVLKNKFPDKKLNLIVGSYFDVPMGIKIFDAAVSVESLHHFTLEEKIFLYQKVKDALKPEGYFILTDFFALSNEEEWSCRKELERLKKMQGIKDEVLYHFDTPLTVLHEMNALRQAGFQKVELLNSWNATHTIKAIR
ncbi:class I SAM-dependent methyltransferase [Ructibacterium gallinarum]|nr:class I SAM-dependent methyltransferase [Ructibacterium gallinarum]